MDDTDALRIFLQTIMELPDIPFNKAEYIETASGNRVSRASVLCGSQNIILNGKNIVQSEAIIRSGGLPHGIMLILKPVIVPRPWPCLGADSPVRRGDLANVRVGRHCVISSRAVIRPPFKKFSKGVAFFPLQVEERRLLCRGLATVGH